MHNLLPANLFIHFTLLQKKILQNLIGTLGNVGNLEYVVGDYNLLIMWLHPLSLYPSNGITYRVEILNLTNLVVVEDTITSENFYIYSPTISKLITCDDFNFTVTPINKLGCGNHCTKSFISEGIYIYLFL